MNIRPLKWEKKQHQWWVAETPIGTYYIYKRGRSFVWEFHEPKEYCSSIRNVFPTKEDAENNAWLHYKEKVKSMFLEE